MICVKIQLDEIYEFDKMRGNKPAPAPAPYWMLNTSEKSPKLLNGERTEFFHYIVAMALCFKHDIQTGFE